MKDRILTDLSLKKSELLGELLRLSRLDLLAQGGHGQKDRAQLIANLERNDQALEAREAQTGILAREQESVLYCHIKEQLQELRLVAERTAVLVAEQQQDLEQEMLTLEANTARVGGYLKSKGAYTDKRRLKGQTKRRGWQPTYQYAQAQR